MLLIPQTKAKYKRPSDPNSSTAKNMEATGTLGAPQNTAANPSAYPRAAEAAELPGWEPEEIADPAATDGAYLSTYGVPTVDALSAIAEQIHTTEERVRIPSIRDRTALCAAMLGLLG